MICPKCGKEIANDSNFCEYCGNPIKKPHKKVIWLTLIAILVLWFLGVMIFGIGMGNQTVYSEEISETACDSAGGTCDTIVHAEGELLVYYKVIVSEARIFEYMVDSNDNSFMEDLGYTYKKGTVFQGNLVHLDDDADWIMFSWHNNGNEMRGFISQSDVVVDHYERDFH